MHKEQDLIKAVKEFQTYAEDYAQPYQDYALKVHSTVHGNIDWGAKKDHNAKIHLNKLGLAVDNWKATVKRGLMNFDDWLKVEQEPLSESAYMSEFNAKRMVQLLLREEDPKIKIADALGLAYLENRMALKIVTNVKEIQGPKGKKYKSPRTELIPLDIWDLLCDPDCADVENGRGMYDIQQIQIPKYQLVQAASESPTIDKPYILEVVKTLEASMPKAWSEQDEAKGKQRIVSKLSRTKMVTINEFYGTVLDDDGMIMEYEKRDGRTLLLENIMFAYSECGKVVREPVPLSDMFIDGENPYIKHRLLRSNKDPLGRAIGHAGYELNHILDEYVSAMADAGIKAASNMTVYKPDFMLDEEQAADGFTYDSNIAIMPDADPSTFISTVRLGELPTTMFNVYNILNGNFAENVSKTDMALSGNSPGKQMRATEVAQAGQTVATLDESILMDVDDVAIEKTVLKIYRQGLNFAKHFSDEDLEYIFADDDAEKGKQKAEKFKELRKNKAKLFEELGYSFRFRGRGLRGIANSARLGQMTMNLMTSLFTNPALVEIAQAEDFSMGKMLAAGVKGMGLDPETLKDQKVGEFARELQKWRKLGQGVADMQGTGQNTPQQGGAAQGSQRETTDVAPGNSGAF